MNFFIYKGYLVFFFCFLILIVVLVIFIFFHFNTKNQCLGTFTDFIVERIQLNLFLNAEQDTNAEADMDQETNFHLC